jgi:hypothetical protein
VGYTWETLNSNWENEKRKWELIPMAYTNIVKTHVLDPLEGLIETEFNLPVSFDKHRGTESIVLKLDSEDFLELLAGGQTRRYNIAIEYEVKKPGGFENVRDHVTMRAERMKRLLYNNSTYYDGSTYRWHDGIVSSIDYLTDEENPEIKRAVIMFECSVTESL